MKKAFLIITTLYIMTFFIVTASADDFSIRGGVKFGMSQEEVRNIESSVNGLQASSSKDEQLGYRVSSLIGVTIGRSNDDIIKYRFENNKLSDIVYWFGYYDSASTAKRNYETIVNAITKKYGKALHVNDGEIFDVYSYAFENYFGLFKYFEQTLYDYSEWLVEFDDGYIVIDVINREMYNSYILDVGFKRISHETVQRIVEKNRQDGIQKNEQKNNDI